MQAPRERIGGYSTVAPPAAARLMEALRPLHAATGERAGRPAPRLGVRYVAVHREPLRASLLVAPACRARAESGLRRHGWRRGPRERPDRSVCPRGQEDGDEGIVGPVGRKSATACGGTLGEDERRRRRPATSELGLTSYEAKAYVALTRRDSSTAAQTARLSNVPRQRIYDVLGSLVEKGLASTRPGDVVKYVANAPARRSTG